MDPSSTICIYCGADRPLDQDTCPNCKRGWLDNHIVQPAAESPASPEPVPAPPPGWFRAPEAASDAAPSEAGPKGAEPHEAALQEAEPDRAEPEDAEPEEPEEEAAAGESPGDAEEAGDATAVMAAVVAGGGDEPAPGEPDPVEQGAVADEHEGGPTGVADADEDAAQPAPGVTAGAFSRPWITGAPPTETGPEASPDDGPEAAGPPEAAPDAPPPTSEEIPAAQEGSPGDEPAMDAAAAITADDPAEERGPEPAEEPPPPGGTVVDEPPPAQQEPPAAEPVAVEEAPGAEEPAEHTEDQTALVAAGWVAGAAATAEPGTEPAADNGPQTENEPKDEGEADGAAEPAVDDAAEPTAVMDAAPADSPVEEPPAEPTEEDLKKARRRERLLLTGAVLAVVVAWIVALFLISRQGDDEPGFAAPSTTAAPDTSTSAPPETTTTAPPTTTTTPETTTTAAPIDPVGEPATDLGLSYVSLGELGFGSGEALGRLVATFDQPDRISPAGEADGLCPAEAGFVAAWGPLEAIFRGDTVASELVGFRVGPDVAGHATGGIATLSGGRVGDTVAAWEAIYPSFDLSAIDGGAGYVLVRPSDGVTLLWGPLSGEGEEAVIAGINSPRSCDGGPGADG